MLIQQPVKSISKHSKELSDVLADSKVTEVVIYEDYSEYDYMEKITTKNTLKDIVEALQKYYNQLKKDDRGGCFYIETVTIVKISTHKYELIFSHGT